MSDLLVQAAVKPVVDQAASSASSSQIAEAKSGDASRFRDAMEVGDLPEQGSGIASPDSPISDLQQADLSAQPPAGAKDSLGDSILNGLEKMRSGQDAGVQKINELVAGAKDAPMTVQQTMELQFHLMQLSMHQDLTAKVADKTSQGVQNLMKNQ